jgi:hypothetical protein
LLPFVTAAFFTTFLAAGFAAALAAGFAAAFAIGAGFFAAGFFAAGFAAAFAAGLLFVAIVLPPFMFFCCFNIFIFMHIKYLVKKRFHNRHKKMLSPRRFKETPELPILEAPTGYSFHST